MFEYRCKPANDEQIQDAECLMGFKFPEDFKTYLKAINGGEIKEDYFVAANYDNFGIDEGIILDTLFGISADEDYNGITLRKSIPDLPDWTLPVGAYIGGMPLFLMDLRIQKLGQIILFDPDSPLNKNPAFSPEELAFPKLENVSFYKERAQMYYFFCSSFGEFLQKFNVVID